MISEIAVGIGTGLISSAVVAVVFYAIGRSDSQNETRIAQLDAALLKLAELDPNKWDESHGVFATYGWFLRAATVMHTTGFLCGETLLRAIASEMRLKCPLRPHDLPPEEHEPKGEARKTEWTQRIDELRCALSRSPLDRMKDTLDG